MCLQNFLPSIMSYIFLYCQSKMFTIGTCFVVTGKNIFFELKRESGNNSVIVEA